MTVAQVAVAIADALNDHDVAWLADDRIEIADGTLAAIRPCDEQGLVDRFGPLPAEAETLVANARIGLLARAAHVARIDAAPAADGLSGEALRLEENSGRMLLKEERAEEERTARVIGLLEALAE